MINYNIPTAYDTLNADQKLAFDMLQYGLNSNQNGQYGQIYAEKFTSASLICKAFYGKMEAQ